MGCGQHYLSDSLHESDFDSQGNFVATLPRVRLSFIWFRVMLLLHCQELSFMWFGCLPPLSTASALVAGRCKRGHVHGDQRRMTL